MSILAFIALNMAALVALSSMGRERDRDPPWFTRTVILAFLVCNSLLIWATW